MELFLIRHLPTDWNKLGVFQGSKDISISPITENDQKIIKKNVAEISIFNPELILTSQLQRTQQTARAYGYNSYITEPLLNELNFGDFEGKEKEYLTNNIDWLKNPRQLTLGERLVDFEKRLLQFIDKYRNYSRILLFGHGSWIRGMVSISETGDINAMNQFTVENNTVHYLDLSKYIAMQTEEKT